MSPISFVRAFCLSLFLSAIGITTEAAILLDNLGETRNSNLSITDATFQAQSFTTTASAYVVDSVTVAVHKNSAFSTGTLNLYIYEANGAGNTPGTLIGSSATASVAASALGTGVGGAYSWTGLNVPLAASTTYYVALGGQSLVGGDQFLWDYTATATGFTGAPSTYAQSVNSGSSWGGGSSTANPAQFQVTAVPEPSTMALGAVGTIALAHLGSRVRRRYLRAGACRLQNG